MSWSSPNASRLVGLLIFACEWGTAAEPVIIAETNRPGLNCFALGEAVLLKIELNYLPPGSQRINISVFDSVGNCADFRSLVVAADAQGGVREVVRLPDSRLGWFRVRVDVPALRLELPARYTRPKGILTYAVVPDPDQRRQIAPERMFFGMQGGWNSRVNVLPYLGVNWLHCNDFAWVNHAVGESFAERYTQAKLRGECYPNLDGNGRSGGIGPNDRIGVPFRSSYCRPDGSVGEWGNHVLVTRLAVGPNEAFTDDTALHGIGRFKPDGFGEVRLREHCLAVAKAWRADSIPPRYYELVWEPEYPWGFKGSPADLTKIHQVAYEAIHEADSEAMVFGPCMGSQPIDLTFYDRLCQAGFFQWVDGISVHPYVDFPPERHGYRNNLLAFKRWMQQRLGRELPIIGTEQGWPTGMKPELEREQARSLVRANLISLGEGFLLNMAFYSVDYIAGAEAGYGIFYNLNENQNWSPDCWSPKPAAAAYAAMTWLLAGKRASATIDWLGATTLGYAYDGDGEVVLALWDWSEAGSRIALPMPEAGIKVRDWMGNSLSVTRDQGDLVLQLGPEPVYVCGVPREQWGMGGRKAVEIIGSRFHAFPGGRVRLPVVAKVSGHIILDRGSALAVSSSAVRSSYSIGSETVLDLDIPESASPGVYPVSITLTGADGRTLGRTGALIEVASPVQVQLSWHPGDSSLSPALELAVSDRQGRPGEGRLDVVSEGIPGGSRLLYRVDACGTAMLRLPMQSEDILPWKTYQSELRIRTSTGYSDLSQHSWSMATAARHCPQGVRPVGWVALAGRERLVRKPEHYHGTSDLSALACYSWDSDGLWFHAEVRDDVHCQPYSGFQTWRGDCIQLGIDIDVGKVMAVTGNELVDRGNRHRASEIDLALCADGPEVFRTGSPDLDRLPIGRLDADSAMLDIRRDGVFTNYVIRIKWRALGMELAPAPGMMLGIAGAINDIDAPGESDPKAIGWFTLKNIEGFGRMYLLAE